MTSPPSGGTGELMTALRRRAVLVRGLSAGGLLLGGALLGGALAGGCGASGPRCVPVSGTVTLDGGKVPGPGFIYFNTTSAGADTPARPGTAEFGADGRFAATTFAPADGLLPGTYALRVDCWKTPPNMDGKPVVSFLPAKYQDAAKSGLTLVVEPDSRPITFDVNLTSR